MAVSGPGRRPDCRRAGVVPRSGQPGAHEGRSDLPTPERARTRRLEPARVVRPLRRARERAQAGGDAGGRARCAGRSSLLRRGRGARARTRSLRLISLRVAVRDAARRGAPPAGARAESDPRRNDPEGLVAVQRPVRGSPADLRRRRFVRAPPRRRGVGGVPPVLHALSLPAPAPELEGRPVPAVAPGQGRWDLAPGVPRDALPPRPRQARRVHACRPAQPAGEPLRVQRLRHRQGAEGGGLPRGADPRQRDEAREARLGTSLGTVVLDVVRVRADDDLQRARRGEKGGVRERGRGLGAATTRCGTSDATRAITLGSPPR